MLEKRGERKRKAVEGVEFFFLCPLARSLAPFLLLSSRDQHQKQASQKAGLSLHADEKSSSTSFPARRSPRKRANAFQGGAATGKEKEKKRAATTMGFLSPIDR